HRLHCRLLQHDLGQPDLVRVGDLAVPCAPGQPSSVTAIPGEKITRGGTRRRGGLDRLGDLIEHAPSSPPASSMNRPSAARPLSDLLRPALAGALKAQGLAAADILRRWEEIAGPRLAPVSMPVRILFAPRPKAAPPEAPHPPATLVLKVESAFALEAD